MVVKLVSFLDNFEFDWDKGNLNKNRLKHNVTASECEDIFYNNPLISDDILHSQVEKRFKLIGQTSYGRFLFIAFTLRGEKVRIISARDTNKREKTAYTSYLKKLRR